MRSSFFDNLAVIFIPLFLLIGLLIAPFSNVSAQSSRIDYTPKLDHLEPQNPNYPKYAPNRIIVKFKKDQSPLVLQEKVDERIKQRSSLTGLLSQQITDVAYHIRGQELPEIQLEKLNSFAEIRDVEGTSIFKLLPQSKETFIYENTEKKDIDVEKIAVDFEKLKEVDFAEPDYVTRAFFTPNDTYYSIQWNYDKINAPNAWDIEKGSANGSVIIAVVDTGIAWNHLDLDDKILAVYDLCSGDMYMDCSGSKGYDYNTHGSHVAGTAAAETNNAKGVAGTGFNTKLISLKALDNHGKGYDTWMANALYTLIYYYSGDHIVVNMSLGLGNNSQVLQNAVTAAHNAGFVIVAAAGNENTNTISYPAGSLEVISVASIGPNDTKSSFSNYGPSWVDIAAPGGEIPCKGDGSNCILSTTSVGIDGLHYFGLMAGTSQASPHVAGAAALVWGKNPSFTNLQVRNILQSSASQIMGTGTYWKYGKLNAAAALAPPAATITPIPTLTPLPTSTPTLTPTPTTAPAPDLIVESINVIDSQTGPSGTYDIVVTIKNQGDATAGFHRNYLYLNPIDQPPILSTQDTSNGTYGGNLPPGQNYEWAIIENAFAETNYVIYAWVDRDNGVIESDDSNNQLMIDYTVLAPTPTPDACPLFSLGDVTCDGVINSADYAVWYTEYLCTIDDNINCTTESDFDNNGIINLFDFVILISGIRYVSLK